MAETEAPPTQAADAEMPQAGTAEDQGLAGALGVAATPEMQAVTVAPPVAPPAPKELEEDAKEDARQKLSQEVKVLANDTTLNLMQSDHGNLFMALSDGGMQYLLAGARANTGMKAGRYYFEAKIVEILNPAESASRGRTPLPRQLLRIGFASAGSDLLLGEGEENVCFDSEGCFLHNRKATMVAQKFVRDQILAVVVNLDSSSPNFNTISLFRDGVRACQPQPLPESMKGKSLFPAITFRNLTVCLNFGHISEKPLPFKCPLIGNAALADAEVVAEVKPKDGKYEVLFPVCLPDEGSFDWLDMWLEKHTDYTELSDRKILQWAEKSGIQRRNGYAARSSNDKPEMDFQIGHLDDLSVHHLLNSVATSQSRNLVVMEVKSMLLESERQKLLRKFSAPQFHRVARVVVGQPKDDFKAKVLSLILKDRQEVADAAFKIKRADEIRKKLVELKQRQMERHQKKVLKAAKKAAAEKADAAQKAAERKEGDEAKEGEEKKDEEMKQPEEEQDEPEDDFSKEEEEIKALSEEKPPKVSLSDEDKKLVFRKLLIPDVAQHVLAQNFANFSLPSKDEGFALEYEWEANEAKCQTYLQKWVLHRKITTRVEDIQPSEWFGKQFSAWQQQLQKWQTKQHDFKAKRGKAEKSEAPEAQEAEAQEEGEKEPEKKEPEKKASDAVAMDVDEENDDLDVFGVTDVCDIGNGAPLFGGFTFEDWALLSLRVELSLLVHSFKKDVKDEERVGIHADLLLFYYSKYLRKTITFKNYGVEKAEELVDLIRDTVIVNSTNSVLEAQLSDELDNFDIFCKLTEECRRDRNLRIDSGDATAELKFLAQAFPSTASFGLASAQSRPGPYSKGAGKGPGGPGPGGFSPGKGYGDAKGGFGKGYGDAGNAGKGFAGGKSFDAGAQKGGNFGSFGGGGKAFGGKDQYSQKGKFGGGGCGKG